MEQFDSLDKRKFWALNATKAQADDNQNAAVLSVEEKLYVISYWNAHLYTHESKFATACSLIRKIPPLSIQEDMNEFELCSRFVDSFLTGHLEDPGAGVYLRWTNETTLETKKRGNQDSLRPDVTITKSHGVRWNSSCGYEEAKGSKQKENHHVVCYDLLKVAAFLQNALDKQMPEGILGIQIVGRTINLYTLLIPATNLHTMLKLDEIKLPDSLQALPSLVTELPHILGGCIGRKMDIIFVSGSTEVCCAKMIQKNSSKEA